MPYIQPKKTKSGTGHQVTFYEHGHKKTKYFPPSVPRKAVELWAAQKDLDVQRNKFSDEEIPLFNSTMTLEKLEEIYQEARQYEIQINRHLLTFRILKNHFTPGYPIHLITTQKLNEFKNALLNKKLKKYDKSIFAEYEKARRGVNKELSHVRTIIRWAYKKGYLKKNPFEKFDFFKNVTQAQITIPTREEEKRFYRELRTRNARLSYLIIRFTGLRRSEVRELCYRNFDIKNEVIILEKQKNRLQKILPMHPSLRRILKWYKITGPDDEKIFHYAPDYLSRYFREALDRANLKHIRNPVHVFRHAFITRVLQETGDLSLANEMARHSDFNTTKRYLHLLPDDLRKRFNNVKFK